MAPNNRYHNTVQDLIELIREIKGTLTDPRTVTQDQLRHYIDEGYRIHTEMQLIEADDETIDLAEILISDLYGVYEKAFGSEAVTSEMKKKWARIGKGKKKKKAA